MALQRSPGYPGMTLDEALAIVSKLYGHSRTNPVDREAAAKDMGYTGLTGRSAKVLSDLSHYGLLEKAGSGSVRVTRRAVEILFPASDESRLEALHEAAEAPTLFAELNGAFEDGLPSENALRSYLHRKEFVPTAIQPILNSYLGTYRSLAEQKVSVSHGRVEETHTEPKGSKVDTVQPSAPSALQGRGSEPMPSGPRREIQMAEGERVIFVEEAGAGQYLKLIATGLLDDTLLEALEDFAKRQRKRLGRSKKEIAVEESEDAGGEDSSGQVH